MSAPSPAEQQAALAALAGLSRRDLAAIWAKLDLSRPERLREPLAQLLREIAARYGAAAATLAADWYSEARDAARAGGSFRPSPALVPEPSRFEALAGWGLGPLFGDAAPAVALGLLGGGLQRIVLNAARDTTAQAVRTDPGSPTFARYASANACAFCALLATRGPVYDSKRSAGDDGEKYHDDCHCIAVPVWPGQEYVEAPWVAEWRQAYKDTGSTNATKALAGMRQILGTH